MTIFEQIRFILALPITASAKVLLLYLLDRQGENANSWPSITTICRDCSLSRPTVVASIELLKNEKLLSVKRPDKPSINQSNLYTVNLTSYIIKPVKKLNQSENLTETGKDSLPELVKKVNPNVLSNNPPTNSKEKYGEFVRLTAEELGKLKKELGLEKTTEMIESLNCYIGSKGAKYKSHYHTILNWVRRDEKNERTTTANGKRKPENFSDQKSNIGHTINL